MKIKGNILISVSNKDIKNEIFEVPNIVTTIGYAAFRGSSGLTSVTIPDKAASIRGYAFSFCRNLKYVSIPNNISSIDPWAFIFCSSLEGIQIRDSTGI